MKVWFFLSVLIFMVMEPVSAQHEVTGIWLSNNGTYMSFVNGLVQVGPDVYSYSIAGNKLTMVDQNGASLVYKYRVQGNQMFLVLSGVGTYVLSRIERPVNGAAGNVQAGYGNTTGNAAAGYGNNTGYGAGNASASAANRYLYGSFCSYSSSGYNTAGSYSTTQHVYFDGKGHYRYGSESSYSGNAGGYYGGGGGYSGTYVVQSNRVVLTEADGTQYVATIYVRQNSGEITELKYGDTLFAKALCE